MAERYPATARPLLDDEAWPPMLDAIRGARRRLDLTQLLFEPEFKPHGLPLADELERAARRGARVRILVNENAAIPDSYDELRERFDGTPVEVKPLYMTPNVLHAKMLLADDEEAFLLDAPFEQKYRDSTAHPRDSARRLDHNPFHAVSLRLTGRALVARLSQLYDALWDETSGLPPPTAATPASARSPGDVEIRWTAPTGLWGESETTQILDAYERAIGDARRLVYIETQYFTSPRIADALARALKREPELEVILLLNEHMDVPTYDSWQALRLADLGVPAHPRIGAFSLRSARRIGAPQPRPVYVHSKVAIVDDAWATLGSANLDSISLHEAQEFGLVAPPNVELNACFDDPAVAASLRRRLWGEHLGDQGLWRADTPPGGWLALWRERAEANAARLRGGNGALVGRIVPYGT